MSDNQDSIGAFRYQRHEPRIPALREGVETRVWPVAIVGGGPVGMALALGLARHGVSSVVFEADETVCIGSRAACISRRSLEIVDRLGALPAFLGKGLAWTGGRSFWKTTEVFRFEMPHDDRQRLPPMINLQQYYIEQYLVDAIDRLNARPPPDTRKAEGSPGAPETDGSIDLRWASEVTGIAAHAGRDGGVDITVRNRLGHYRTTARWLVACDGGQSLVRKWLDLALVGTAYEGRYVIIDIHLPSAHPTERRAWFDPPWNPGSTVLMHRQVDDIWRIDYQLRQGEDTATALLPENVQRFVQKHLDSIGEGHLPWETVWTSVYRAGAMTLESYRHGRVLFAGNAAHALPIFGVRGLNSGFDDSYNLAWKLARVARGESSDTLLDSYSQERVGAFHTNAASAMRSTEFMSPPSRGFDLLREAALSLAASHRSIATLINPRQTEAVSYPDSPLSTPDRTGLAGPPPGALLADFEIQAPTGHLTQLLGPGFALIAFSADGPPDADMTAAVSAAMQESAIPLQCILLIPPSAGTALPPGQWQCATADPQVLRKHSSDGVIALYLLRPDRHIAARWRSGVSSTAHGSGDQPLAASLAAAIRRAAGIVPVAPSSHLLEKLN